MLNDLFPVELPPGVFKNGTKRQARGRWFDGNLVRFFERAIGPVGGWLRVLDDTGVAVTPMSGVARASIAFRSDTYGIVQAFGTHTKLYTLQSGALTDITPVGFTAGQADTASVAPNGKYGKGLYGVGRYGRGSLSASLVPATTWQLAAFGTLLAGVASSDKKLYTWAGDPAVKPTVPANAPSSVLGVVATPERFLFALGAQYNAGTGTFVANSRSVAWPSQESTTDWVPTAVNTAGDFELATNGKLVCGRASRGETLLWTDADLHSAQYISGQLVYSFKRVGENCGIISPNAVAMPGGLAVWMGANGFFVYDGFVKPVPCDVHDHIFTRINMTQAAKVWAVTVSEFNEVWFFYPAGNEIDSYAAFNYVENHWTVGSLARTTGYDAGAVNSPVFVAPTGEIYQHEQRNQSHGGALPYLESGPVEPGNGDRRMAVTEIVPDASAIGDVQMTFFLADDPTTAETSVVVTAPLTQPSPVRFSAKQIRLRYDTINDTDWRVGLLRLAGRPSSRR